MTDDSNLDRSSIVDQLSSQTSQPMANDVAWTGFVMAFVFSPLGLPISFFGFRRSKELDGQGRNLAIAGMVVSSIFLLAALPFIVYGNSLMF